MSWSEKGDHSDFKKCKGNIGKAVEQEYNLWDKVETVR